MPTRRAQYAAVRRRAGNLTAVAASLIDALAVLRDLVFPSQCPGCGVEDTVLCSECEQYSCTPQLPWSVLDAEVPILALHPYQGVMRSLLLAAKHDTVVDYSAWLARAGHSLAEAFVAQNMAALNPRPHARRVWVVPAPSSWKRHLSGHEVTLSIARGFSKTLADRCDLPVHIVEAVGAFPWAHSQAGKGREQRRAGRKGAMYRRCMVPEDVTVILLDDVVATGATISELIRCIGVTPWAVVALAHSVKR